MGDVSGHYASGRLLESVLAAMAEAGLDPEKLERDQIGPFEEFHTLGAVATRALAEAASITASDRVLDVGCGIGGPARHLAREFGCHVVGIDLTEEFCEVASELNRRTGHDDLVRVEQGDALDLPFPDGTFDVVWTMHVSMNIADKAAMYRQFARVLRPGGRLAFFDVVAGQVQPAHYPQPWASEASQSFLDPPEQMLTAVQAAGFAVEIWQDVMPEALEFYRGLASAPPSSSPLGLQLMIKNFPVVAPNIVRNAQEGRIGLLRAVCRLQ